MPTFAESEYNIEDWLPVVEPFDEHERMELRGGFEEHRDEIRADIDSLPDEVSEKVDDWESEKERIENIDQKHGVQVSYQATGTSGELAAQYSPSARAEGSMLEGTLFFTGDVSGSSVAEAQQEIVQEYSTPYLSTNEEIREEEGSIALLDVPENYNPRILEDTVQAIVDIYDEAQRLEDALEETIDAYENG